MVVIMDVESGKYAEDEFGAFQEEVLNSQWLPNQQQYPEIGEVRPGLQEVASARLPSDAEAEAFLRAIYLSQE